MMKRLALPLLAAVALSALPALAQDRPHGDHDHPRGHKHRHDPAAMVEHLSEKLGLTAEQQAAARPILERAAQERHALMEAARADGPPSEEERNRIHAQMEAIGQRTESELAPILDDQQMAKLREMKAEMRERHEARRAKRESRRSS